MDEQRPTQQEFFNQVNNPKITMQSNNQSSPFEEKGVLGVKLMFYIFIATAAMITGATTSLVLLLALAALLEKNEQLTKALLIITGLTFIITCISTLSYTVEAPVVFLLNHLASFVGRFSFGLSKLVLKISSLISNLDMIIGYVENVIRVVTALIIFGKIRKNKPVDFKFLNKYL